MLVVVAVVAGVLMVVMLVVVVVVVVVVVMRVVVVVIVFELMGTYYWAAIWNYFASDGEVNEKNKKSVIFTHSKFTK